MKNSLLPIVFLALISCVDNSRYHEQIENNNILIMDEFNTIQIKLLLNPKKVDRFFSLAKSIKTDYDNIHENYLNKNSQIDSLANNLIEKTMNINTINWGKYKKPNIEDINDVYFEMVQVQYLTLFCLKSLRESINYNEYSTNKFHIESKRNGDKIKLLVCQMDSTDYPTIKIGKLKENTNEFMDTFVSPRYNEFHLEVPINALEDDKIVEGIIIVRTIYGAFDTVKFRSEINRW